jgi:catechol 2,3-dioxygenase-like lactoylglutathione lyase family enzyme
MTIVGIDHVQLAMPAGREDDARRFYTGLLGIPEAAKPAALVSRGGVWFERGSLKVHLGVEGDFRPARKAHPGLCVDEFDAFVARLRTAAVVVTDDDALNGRRRAFIDDPFGNRIELIER